jgi:hypothetical protein
LYCDPIESEQNETLCNGQKTLIARLYQYQKSKKMKMSEFLELFAPADAALIKPRNVLNWVKNLSEIGTATAVFKSSGRPKILSTFGAIPRRWLHPGA